MILLNELVTKLAYHDQLNPKIWNRTGEVYTLRPIVQEHLTAIANRFVVALELPVGALVDCIFTGSNANYNWTHLSDVDLHVTVDYAKLGGCALTAESCLRAKKSLWNDHHDLSIYGHPVELYASNAATPLTADAGAWSIWRKNEAGGLGVWIQRPTHREPQINDHEIVIKATELAHEIDELVKTHSDDQDAVQVVVDKLWKYRQAGLQRGGEFSTENLVFKALRNNGYVDKIKSFEAKSQDKGLSLESLR